LEFAITPPRPHCTYVHEWLNKDEEDFGYQNLMKEEIAQQVEEDSSSEEDEAKFRFSEVKQS
jgi:hypothetical protein